MPVYRCAECGALNRSPHPGDAPGACFRCRHPMEAIGRAQDVDATALVAAIVASPAPVLVDFSPRGQRSAVVDGIARERAGEILVLHVDTTAQPAAAAAYHVSRLPTMVLFSGGVEVARRSGAPDPSELGAWMAVARQPAARREP